MKKLSLLVLALLFAFDPADAQLALSGPSNNSYLPGLSQSSELSMMKKRKRRKKSKRRGKGRSTAPTLTAGPGVFLGIPTGDFADAVKGGLGFSVDADFWPSSMFSVGFSSGMYSFKYDVESNDFLKFNKSTYSIIPLCAKGTYYFIDGPVRPYASLNAGMFISKSKLNYDEIYIFMNQATNDLDTLWLTTEALDITTDFGIAPVFGAMFEMSDNIALNANLRYDMIFTEETSTTLLGINLGLLFKF